jgi:thymidine phosphorylase
MKPGILFVIVGASGVGKDTLIAGAMTTLAAPALAASGRYVACRRAITRPEGPGEDHEPVSPEEFERRATAGGFLHRWRAHGLSYGLPIQLRAELEAGRHVIANGSRGALAGLIDVVPRLVVVEITAPRARLRERILARGRETAAEIDLRLDRSPDPLPDGIELLTVANDGSVEAGIEQLVAVIETAAARMALRRMPIHAGRANMAFLPLDSSAVPAATYAGSGRIELLAAGRSVRAAVSMVEPGALLGDDEIGLSAEAFAALALPEGHRVSIRRTPTPGSRALLCRKIDGGRLCADEYETLFRDIVEDRYPESEVSAFLVKTIQNLDDVEVVAVAQARCRFMARIAWDAPIVVDKHSLGGIPGSRITLIVVPIVAAHGLLMPKTSSRAITSASGTADAMEAACRVDLTAADVARVVRHTGACIAWNGRLNHSALDDVVNAITRPLGLDSNRWSVASIMSKKWTSGSTHVAVDCPYGPNAKLKTLTDARELCRVFELVGAGLGLTVRALATDGSSAIGRGIGPALELRDVGLVLDCDPAAPSDLREKALIFAAEILSFDPAIGDATRGRARAEALLASGAARDRFDRIVAAQGRMARTEPGPLTHVVRAARAGRVASIDGWQLAGVARSAGAPAVKAAGIDLATSVGQCVAAGAALYTIHATGAADLDAAIELSSRRSGITLSEVFETV